MLSLRPLRRSPARWCASLLVLTCTRALFAAETPVPAVTAPAAPVSMPPAAPVAATPIASGVFAWAAMSVVPTPVGERRDVFNGATPTMKNLRVHVTTLRPGQTSHLPHRHPEEEVLIVKEGVLDVSINGQIHRATTGAVILFDSGDAHGLTNVGDTPATFHVVRLTTTATPLPPTKP